MTATPQATGPAAAIDLAAEDYRAAHDRLADLLGQLRDHQQTVARQRLPALRAAVIAVREARSRLAARVDGHRGLFRKPKTRIQHGIKHGLKKAPDAWSYPPPAMLCAAIREHLPRQAKTLIEVTEAPVKTAVKRLPADSLELIGVAVEKGADQLLIEPVDSEVDRLIDTLLGSLADELEPAAETAEEAA